MMFFFYSCAAMCMIFRFLPAIDSVLAGIPAGSFPGKILALFSRRSMTIFLYQSFVFLLLVKLGNVLLPAQGIIVDTGKAVFYFIAAVAACALAARLLGWTENLPVSVSGSTEERNDQARMGKR